MMKPTAKIVSHTRTPILIVGGGPVGMFLSILLTSYNQEHVIIDKRKCITKHPQAHFITARSMEIIRAHMPNVFDDILTAMPHSDNWRDFVYCNAVAGKHYSRVDNLDARTTPNSFFQQSSSNVVHLPQHTFESILRKHMQPKSIALGCDVVSIDSNDSNGTSIDVQYKSNKDTVHKVTASYVIAADGSRSFVRENLNIPMIGKPSLQTLINVHFKCRGLHRLLQPRSAMLYFTFNHKAPVCVFVLHNPDNDEWVCQIPIFPPFQELKDYSKDQIISILFNSIGTEGRSDVTKNSIEILSTNTWTMNAQVAAQFNGNKQLSGADRVFLVGDAAHRFPPAGGFGMNTGLQDAHNIAWKLALALDNHTVHACGDGNISDSNKKNSLLLTYDTERRPVATETTELSLKNYNKSIAAAKTLGVDPALAAIAIGAIDSLPLVPFAAKKGMVNAALTTGLQALYPLSTDSAIGNYRIRALNRLVNANESLPLIFPKHDIDYQYGNGAFLHGKNTDSPSATVDIVCNDDVYVEPMVRVGGRIPHMWLRYITDTSATSGDIISSVDIAALYRHPSVVLLVRCGNGDPEQYMDKIKSVIKDMKGIVAVHVIAASANSIETHADLQQLFQSPNYHRNSCSSVGSSSGSMADTVRLRASDKTHSRLVDVTSEFQRKVHDSITVVALRPDGYVMGLCRTNEDETAFIHRLYTILQMKS